MDINTLEQGDEIENKDFKHTLFKGRYNRSQFMGSTGLWYIISALPTIGLISYNPNLETIGSVLFIILSRAVLYLVGARRYNDLGDSSWYGILMAIPGLNTFVFLYLSFARGQEQDNKYGPSLLK